MLKENSAFPDFSLPDAAGNIHSFGSLSGKKGLVLYFYPKDSTPGCTAEACDFRDIYSLLNKKGWNLCGISRDSGKAHQKFTDKNSLNFTILSDSEGELCGKCGVWQKKKLAGREYMGIVRTTFVIEHGGNILKKYENVRVSGHAAQILADLSVR